MVQSLFTSHIGITTSCVMAANVQHSFFRKVVQIV